MFFTTWWSWTHASFMRGLLLFSLSCVSAFSFLRFSFLFLAFQLSLSCVSVFSFLRFSLLFLAFCLLFLLQGFALLLAESHFLVIIHLYCAELELIGSDVFQYELAVTVAFLCCDVFLFDVFLLCGECRSTCRCACLVCLQIVTKLL